MRTRGLDNAKSGTLTSWQKLRLAAKRARRAGLVWGDWPREYLDVVGVEGHLQQLIQSHPDKDWLAAFREEGWPGLTERIVQLVIILNKNGEGPWNEEYVVNAYSILPRLFHELVQLWRGGYRLAVCGREAPRRLPAGSAPLPRPWKEHYYFTRARRGPASTVCPKHRCIWNRLRVQRQRRRNVEDAAGGCSIRRR